MLLCYATVDYADPPEEFGKMIYPDNVFARNMKPDWVLNPFFKKILREIDQSELLDMGVIESPVLGQILPFQVSGGVKTLTMAAYYGIDNFCVFSHYLGDNAIIFLDEAAKIREKNFSKDLKFVSSHPHTPDGNTALYGRIVQTGEHFKTFSELDRILYDGRF